MWQLEYSLILACTRSPEYIIIPTCPFETFTLKVDNCTGVPPLPKNVKYKSCLIIVFKTYFLLIAILKIIYLYIYFIYTV